MNFNYPEHGLTNRLASTTQTNVDDFIDSCATAGQQAKCCVVPVAGQDLLCQDVKPTGW
jgi:hypothetical protein